jgi:hypothetical protein
LTGNNYARVILQLLRPFVTNTDEFDRSFAESFAIAEFRTMSSSAEASRKLLSLLSSYEQITEDTAAMLVANELLLERLKKSKNDHEFAHFVDAALMAENANLFEDLIVLKQELDANRIAKDNADETNAAALLKAEDDRTQIALAKSAIENTAEGLLAELDQVKVQSASQIDKLTTAAELAQASATETRKTLDQVVDCLCVAGTLLSGFGFAALCEYIVGLAQWQWLLTHPNSYSLRIAAYLVVTLFVAGLLRSKWRKGLWAGSLGFAALLLLLISLIGGPTK